MEMEIAKGMASALKRQYPRAVVTTLDETGACICPNQDEISLVDVEKMGLHFGCSKYAVSISRNETDGIVVRVKFPTE